MRRSKEEKVSELAVWAFGAPVVAVLVTCGAFGMAMLYGFVLMKYIEWFVPQVALPYGVCLAIVLVSQIFHEYPPPKGQKREKAEVIGLCIGYAGRPAVILLMGWVTKSWIL